MKKLLTSLVLFSPLSVFADNLVFNGGFDMTPWDTGWVVAGKDTNGGAFGVQADTINHSSQKSCYIWTFTASGACGWRAITQTIYPPAINCTCRAFLKYNIGYWYGSYADVAIEININNKWKTEWSDMAIYSGESIDSTKNWINWEKVYTGHDTIRGIYFEAGSGTYSPDNMSGANLFIDDVYISGEEIGIEEKSNIKTPSTTLRASPNPFVQKTVVSGQWSEGNEIQIYDVAGNLVKETKDNIIGKDLKAGIYFIKLKSQDYKKLVKIIRVK
ncbi:MAG: T9SS type A sorting domain-containing protein [bacterium]|nr:T9SS type A sorting domain-containing protein [bacterium]